MKRTKKSWYKIAIVILMMIAIIWISPQIMAQRLSMSHTNSEEIRAIIRQARDSWINGDANAFAFLFTQDGEFIAPGAKWVGQNAIRQIAADFAASASNVTIKIQRIIVEGNQAVVEWYWEDTENATGNRNRADDAIVVDFEQGKIKRWREYIDTQTPAMQK